MVLKYMLYFEWFLIKIYHSCVPHYAQLELIYFGAPNIIVTVVPIPKLFNLNCFI